MSLVCLCLSLMDFMSNQLEGFGDWILFSEHVILQTRAKTVANWVKYLEKSTGLLSCLNTANQNMCKAAPAWNSNEFLILVFDFSFAGNSSPLTWHFLEATDVCPMLVLPGALHRQLWEVAGSGGIKNPLGYLFAPPCDKCVMGRRAGGKLSFK